MEINASTYEKAEMQSIEDFGKAQQKREEENAKQVREINPDDLQGAEGWS